MHLPPLYKMIEDRTTHNNTKIISRQEPQFVNEFCSALSVSSSTITSYKNDLCFFLEYLLGVIPSLDGVRLQEFPLEVFTLLDRDDIEKYISYLKSVRFLSNASVYAKIAAIKAFYGYLFDKHYTFTNPCKQIKLSPGKKNPGFVLTPSQVRFLFTGMRENKLFLVEGADGETEVVAATDLVKIRREPVIIRNIAILHLFLFCGISLPELNALNVSDVSLRNYTITIKKGTTDYEQICFENNPDVIKALTDYINGVQLPSELTKRFFVAGKTDFEWCQAQTRNINFENRLLADHPGMDEDYYESMRKLTSAMRRQGREGLKPTHTEKALFVSMRGKRMSKIMIQKMIREMLQTYLGIEGKNLSATLLRRTCAANRITGSTNIKDVAKISGVGSVKRICSSLRE
mgnify:CR=1 FL=1